MVAEFVVGRRLRELAAVYGLGGAALGTDNPVRAFIAYDRSGNMMERVED